MPRIKAAPHVARISQPRLASRALPLWRFLPSALLRREAGAAVRVFYWGLRGLGNHKRLQGVSEKITITIGAIRVRAWDLGLKALGVCLVCRSCSFRVSRFPVGFSHNVTNILENTSKLNPIPN